MRFIISKSTLKPSLVKHFKWLLVHNEIHSIKKPTEASPSQVFQVVAKSIPRAN